MISTAVKCELCSNAIQESEWFVRLLLGYNQSRFYHLRCAPQRTSDGPIRGIVSNNISEILYNLDKNDPIVDPTKTLNVEEITSIAQEQKIKQEAFDKRLAKINSYYSEDKRYIKTARISDSDVRTNYTHTCLNLNTTFHYDGGSSQGFGMGVDEDFILRYLSACNKDSITSCNGVIINIEYSQARIHKMIPLFNEGILFDIDRWSAKFPSWDRL